MTAQKEEKHMEVLVFTHHQVIQAATNSLLRLVHLSESFINVFCYKTADVCVLEVWMIYHESVALWAQPQGRGWC